MEISQEGNPKDMHTLTLVRKRFSANDGQVNFNNPPLYFIFRDWKYI